MRRFSPREINWLMKWKVSPCGAGSCFARYRTVLGFAGQTSPTSQMPVEYMTGWAEFYGRNFEVNRHVLIPRIETEQIVDEAMKTFVPYSQLSTLYSPVIADIGTGCGCIGTTLYLELVKLGIRPTIYMSDISKKALAVAEKNIYNLALKRVEPDCHVSLDYSRDPRNDRDNSPIGLIKSDLFDSYQKDLRFDVIIANLPYIPSSRIPKLPGSVKDFEPHLALDGGTDGLKLINKLITQSQTRLKPKGILLLEIDENHKIKDFLLLKNFKAKIIKDQFGKKRFVKINKRD